MTYISDLLGTLAFRSRAIRALAERRATVAGGICFSVGYLLYALVRSLVYASLPELMSQRSVWIGYYAGFQLFQILLFLLVIYIPFVIIASNAIAGDGLGLSISKQEYRAHVSALLPLWGALSLFAAPLQWFVPHFLIIGIVEISIGMLIRSILVMAYTLWAIRRLNYLSAVQVLGMFALSWFTFPVYYLLTSFLFALPFFVLIPLIFLASQWFRGYHVSHTNEREYRRHLQALTANPQDADAQYQLGLIYLRRLNLDAARRYFEKALKIDPDDADYHYFLARAHELKGEWSLALEQYEETYRLNPEYGVRRHFSRGRQKLSAHGQYREGHGVPQIFPGQTRIGSGGEVLAGRGAAKDRGYRANARAVAYDCRTSPLKSAVFPQREPGMDLSRKNR